MSAQPEAASPDVTATVSAKEAIQQRIERMQGVAARGSRGSSGAASPDVNAAISPAAVPPKDQKRGGRPTTSEGLPQASLAQGSRGGNGERVTFPETPKAEGPEVKVKPDTMRQLRERVEVRLDIAEDIPASQRILIDEMLVAEEAEHQRLGKSDSDQTFFGRLESGHLNRQDLALVWTMLTQEQLLLTSVAGIRPRGEGRAIGLGENPRHIILDELPQGERHIYEGYRGRHQWGRQRVRQEVMELAELGVEIESICYPRGQRDERVTVGTRLEYFDGQNGQVFHDAVVKARLTRMSDAQWRSLRLSNPREAMVVLMDSLNDGLRRRAPGIGERLQQEDFAPQVGLIKARAAALSAGEKRDDSGGESTTDAKAQVKTAQRESEDLNRQLTRATAERDALRTQVNARNERQARITALPGEISLKTTNADGLATRIEDQRELINGLPERERRQPMETLQKMIDYERQLRQEVFELQQKLGDLQAQQEADISADQARIRADRLAELNRLIDGDTTAAEGTPERLGLRRRAETAEDALTLRQNELADIEERNQNNQQNANQQGGPTREQKRESRQLLMWAAAGERYASIQGELEDAQTRGSRAYYTPEKLTSTATVRSGTGANERVTISGANAIRSLVLGRDSASWDPALAAEILNDEQIAREAFRVGRVDLEATALPPVTGISPVSGVTTAAQALARINEIHDVGDPADRAAELRTLQTLLLASVMPSIRAFSPETMGEFIASLVRDGVHHAAEEGPILEVDRVYESREAQFQSRGESLAREGVARVREGRRTDFLGMEAGFHGAPGWVADGEIEIPVIRPEYGADGDSGVAGVTPPEGEQRPRLPVHTRVRVRGDYVDITVQIDTSGLAFRQMLPETLPAGPAGMDLLRQTFPGVEDPALQVILESYYRPYAPQRQQGEVPARAVDLARVPRTSTVQRFVSRSGGLQPNQELMFRSEDEAVTLVGRLNITQASVDSRVKELIAGDSDYAEARPRQQASMRRGFEARVIQERIRAEIIQRVDPAGKLTGDELETRIQAERQRLLEPVAEGQMYRLAAAGRWMGPGRFNIRGRYGAIRFWPGRYLRLEQRRPVVDMIGENGRIRTGIDRALNPAQSEQSGDSVPSIEQLALRQLARGEANEALYDMDDAERFGRLRALPAFIHLDVSNGRSYPDGVTAISVRQPAGARGLQLWVRTADGRELLLQDYYDTIAAQGDPRNAQERAATIETIQGIQEQLGIQILLSAERRQPRPL